MNENFIQNIFPDILQEVFSTKKLIGESVAISYLIPIIEIVTAVALFIPKTRKFGLILAITIHVTIIFLLSPIGIGQNYVVIPWNIAMCILALLLFHRNSKKIKLLYSKDFSLYVTSVIISFLVLIAPAMHSSGLWDYYLSFNLYSGKYKTLHIAISDEAVPKLKNKYNDFFMKLSNIEGGKVIDVNSWALQELNVPLYPELRVFRKVSKSFCNYSIAEDGLYFIIVSPSIEQGNYKTWQCKDLIQN